MLLTAVALVAPACGDADTDSADDPGAEVTDDRAALRLGDLPDEDPFTSWSKSENERPARTVDPALPYCGDPYELSDTPAGSLDASPTVEFWTSTDSTTTISVMVRGFTVGYADDAAADAAFDVLDAGAFDACIAKSVVPDARDDVGVDEDDSDRGDRSRVFRHGLDDFTYFDGNDNGTEFAAFVTRVGSNISVVEFVYSGQYFDDVAGDLDDLETKVVDAVTARLG